MNVRFQWTSIAAAAGLLLAACAPQRAGQPKGDPTKEAGYVDAIGQLVALDRLGEGLLKGGLSEDAAAAVTKGQPLQVRLLAPPRPTLEAMEAVADLDDLYARMLLADHHDGFARMLYEKNRARWKSWKPQSDETAERLRKAEAGMAECDRRLRN